jgi:hypothetical protein
MDFVQLLSEEGSMSLVGHRRTNQCEPKSTDVRCAPNSGHWAPYFVVAALRAEVIPRLASFSGRRQSAKPTPDNMRLQLRSPWTPKLTGPVRSENLILTFQ